MIEQANKTGTTPTTTSTRSREGRTLMVLMNPDERLALDDYAKRRGENVSVVVRQLIREALKSA